MRIKRERKRKRVPTSNDANAASRRRSHEISAFFALEAEILTAHSGVQAFSVFEYLYRDAGNYKAWGELLLAGRATEANIAEIRRHLDSGEYFIPERVGVPPLQGKLHQYSGGPSEDDHLFHEFVDLRPAKKLEIETLSLWGSLETLKARFRASRSMPWRYASTDSG